MTGAGLIPRRCALRAALVLGSAAAVATLAGCDAAPQGVVSTDGVLDRRFGLDNPRWRLAAPEGRAPRGLVVALHGRGGDADSAFDLGYADAVAGTGLALVSVDGGNGYWHARRDGSDSGAMVREELIPLALRRCGLLATTRVGLLGWSMGETPEGAYDGRADFDRHSIFGRVERLAGIPVRLDCGRSDPFIAANRALAERLAGVETHFDPGGHEDAWWRAHAPAEMAWLAARA